MENIWESDYFKTEEGAFIKFEVGVERILKWLDVCKKEQSPNSKFPTADGMVIQLEFQEGEEKKFFWANSSKNKLIEAMKFAGVQIGDSFIVKREGIGFEDTTYDVHKIDAGSIPF